MPLPPESGAPEAVFALLKLADCRIDDVWHAVGLAGSGSNDIVVADVFIADHRVLDMAAVKGGPTPGSAVNDHYLYRLPALAPFTYNLIGCALGVTRGIAETIVEGLKAQRTRRGAAVVSYPSIQLRVAESMAEIEAASALLFRTRDDVVRLGRAGGPYPAEERTRWRRDAGYVSLSCVRAVERLFPILGAQGLMSDHPVQRAWRDLRAISHHFGLSWDIQALLYAAALFDLPSPDPRM